MLVTVLSLLTGAFAIQNDTASSPVLLSHTHMTVDFIQLVC